MRSRRKPKTIPRALVCGLVALIVHASVFAIWQANAPVRHATLTVVVAAGENASGSIGGVDPICSGECVANGERAQTLVAIPGKDSVFAGFEGECGPQSFRSFTWAATWLPEFARQHEELIALATQPEADDPKVCIALPQTVSRTITARFEAMPKEVNVAWIADSPELDKKNDVKLPALAAAPALAPSATKPPDAERPIELALAPPPPPQAVPPPPEPEKVPEKKETPKIEASKLKSVEVPNKNEVAEAPSDAEYLSDKNRDVEEETAGKETNLEKESEGETTASEENDNQDEQVGGKEEKIAQLETSESSSLSSERDEPTAHSGKDEKAEGVKAGDEGQNGAANAQSKAPGAGQPGVFSMRGIEGRGGLAQPGPGAGGSDGKPSPGNKAGKKGRPGIKTQLEFSDYERIVGKDAAQKEVELAQRKLSMKKGRYQKKLDALRSTLENFTPEVKPGNQTALKTRAAPFAVFIARMHRNIHELWGFGYLESLDDQPPSSPLNDWDLWTKLEIVINPDGTVEKITVVRHSGQTVFDVAAIDVVNSAAPYDAPPPEIHSPDGKTYVHWAFHRDWQQCGTFGAEPFILAGESKPAVAQNADSQATERNADPDLNEEVKYAANVWLTGFTHNDIAKMVKVSMTPFSQNGSVVADSDTEVSALYGKLLKQLKNRQLREWRVFSAARYRKQFGKLPDGVAAESQTFFLVLALPGEKWTLAIAQRGKEYRVSGVFTERG